MVSAFPERFQVASMSAGENVDLMAEQVRRYRPASVSMGSERAAAALCAKLRESGERKLPEIGHGRAGMERVATLPEADVVLSATVGVAGLPATYAALEAGKQVALANKEVLVAAGELITRSAEAHGTELLPVDSEHNGVHQCLRAGAREEARLLVLTASGGPFLHTPADQLPGVTVEQALKHPTWQMGNRITIDSATMMNKGFEVIEAKWLFGFPPEQIRVKIHPQSTIHSLVEFVDGSVMAQLSVTDMKVPIQYALTYPERLASNEPGFDWSQLGNLEFYEPDLGKFPCLRLAYGAMKEGGSHACVLNAADEVAVAAFLDGRIGFTAISCLIEDTLNAMASRKFHEMEDVLEQDRASREMTGKLLSRYQN